MPSRRPDAGALISVPNDTSEGSHLLPRTYLRNLEVFPLLFIHFSETVITYTLYPFIAELIGTLDKDANRENTGYYLGILELVPNVISAVIVLLWGRLGDLYGRKPILLANSLGLAIAITCFGSSQTFSGLILSRALEGLCKTSKPTIKSAVAESSDDARLAFIFSLLPVTYALGSIVGPFIGGTFATPAKRFPDVFGALIWSHYPYLLPCMFSAMICLLSFGLTFVFFQETLPSIRALKKPDGFTVVYSDSLVGRSPSIDSTVGNVLRSEPYTLPYVSWRSRSRFLRVLANYSMFVLLATSFNATFALFLASPTQSGGLFLPPHTIGTILSLSGILHGLLQACFFTRMHARWGPHKIYKVSAASFVLIYAAIPLMGTIAKRAGRPTPLVWIILALQQIACTSSFAGFTCMFIFIAKSSPSPAALGRTNAIAQTVYSVMAGLGPAASTSLTAISIQHQLLGGTLAQVIQAALGFVALYLAHFLPEFGL